MDSPGCTTAFDKQLTTGSSLEPLERIGAGLCGSVWASPCSTDHHEGLVVMKREDGTTGRSLTNEYNIQKHLIQTLEARPIASFSFNVPVCHGFLSPSDQHWPQILPRLPPGSMACNALLSEKVSPLGYSAREKLTRSYGPDKIQESILKDPKNTHCLVRVYLGRRKPVKIGEAPRRLEFFSLRNFPLYVNRMEDLGIEPEPYAQVMAEALAYMHWVARIDANDVEFVLGLPRPGDEADLNFGSKPLGVHALWVIDFDCCHMLPMDTMGVEMAARSFWRNDPYYPRPGSANEADQKTWSTFKSHFLRTSQVMLMSEDDSVKQLPEMMMDKIASMGRDFFETTGSN